MSSRAGIPFSELASDGSFFIFMLWYSYRGLETHLQRAHAGHTQVAAKKSLAMIPDSGITVLVEQPPLQNVSRDLQKSGFCVDQMGRH
jgi:hypothetical protein